MICTKNKAAVLLIIFLICSFVLYALIVVSPDRLCHHIYGDLIETSYMKPNSSHNSDDESMKQWELIVSFLECQKHLENTISWVNIIVRCIFPFIILLGANLVMIVILWKNSVKRKHLCQNNTSKNNTLYPTVKLIVITLTYLFLSIPSALSIVLLHADRPYELKHILEVIGRYCDCINSSINFFLYCISGRLFRETFIRMLKITWNNIRLTQVTGTGSDRPVAFPKAGINTESGQMQPKPVGQST